MQSNITLKSQPFAAVHYNKNDEVNIMKSIIILKLINFLRSDINLPDTIQVHLYLCIKPDAVIQLQLSGHNAWRSLAPVEWLCMLALHKAIKRGRTLLHERSGALRGNASC